MKVLTYNFLTSKALKGVTVGFPLKLKISKKEVIQAEFDSEFISRIISRLDWPTVYHVSELIGLCGDVPQKLPANFASDQDLLLKLHHLLLEIDIIEGEMECPETGKVFPILNGIPNMLSNEDEV